MAIETEARELNLASVRESLRAFLESGNGRQNALGFILIAINSETGKPVACLMITYACNVYNSKTIAEWWYQSVFVDPAYRGRKIFKRLFSYVEELNKPNGFPLKLYVEHDNVRAQGVYERLGMSDEKAAFLEFDTVYGKNKDQVQFRDTGKYRFTHVTDASVISTAASDGESRIARKSRARAFDVANGSADAAHIGIGRHFEITTCTSSSGGQEEGAQHEKVGSVFCFIEFTDWRSGLILYVYDVRTVHGEARDALDEVFAAFMAFALSAHEDVLPVKCVRVQIGDKSEDVAGALEKIGFERCHYKLFGK